MHSVLEEIIKQFVNAEMERMEIRMKIVRFDMTHHHQSVLLILIVHLKRLVSMSIAKIHV
jgi:hypothetical protein